MDYGHPDYKDMELSTQIVIAEALKRGVNVEILDREDNFIRLSKDSKIEYVRQSNQTSLDSYITSLILNNKLVQKQVMDEAGVRVPKGKHYSKASEAISDFDEWHGSSFVVKPKSTNFGYGIAIFEGEVSNERYIEAVEAAFKEDSAILIEEFIPGIECRFLVIGDQCTAVLHRVPANVTGDGIHSISELVEEKNSDPRRGKGYKTPLEKIELGVVEKTVLQEKGLDFDYVPEDGEQIFLRKNSNISTGGDSIDYTDKVHADYKTIAVKASQAVGAQICGVDMILSDFENPPTHDNHGIIELNWNPVLYFHDYPYVGENRHTAIALLDALGF